MQVLFLAKFAHNSHQNQRFFWILQSDDTTRSWNIGLPAWV